MNDGYRLSLWPAILLVAALFYCAPTAQAADLQPETLQAWRTWVDATEQRMAAELSSKNGFLALDFQNAPQALQERQAVLSGEIPVRRIVTKDKSGRQIEVPEGAVHHWRGAVFIPGVSLESMLYRLENPNSEDTKQEDVLESAVLEKTPGRLKLYLKLQRSKIVTVRYNTEHLVQYRRHGKDRASSSSVATKIAEIERLGNNNEREKSEGHDRGFLWRMNSYWRYEQINGGVLVECESITLSRSIPPVIEYMARPLINSVARESMQRTLQSMRTRMAKSPKPATAENIVH